MFAKSFASLNRICSKEIDCDKSQYLTFAVYGLINTILPYLMWEYNARNEFTIILHIFASILCFVLLFFEDWALPFKKYFPLYWYFSLLYCLPFLSTYMIFNNGLSPGWIINSILSLFLLSFLVNWMIFLFFVVIGISLGSFSYWSHSGFVEINYLSNSNYVFLIYMYCCSVVIGGVFARKKFIYVTEREKYLKLLSSAIAHELHTPLLSISMGTRAIKDQLSISIEKLSENPQSQPNIISEKQLKIIAQALANIEAVNTESFSIINMFLFKTRDDFKNEELSEYSIKDCIERTLETYPLTDQEKDMIVLNIKDEFIFRGNEILMMHVLFNLLKNAIYYIKEMNKGKIYITLSLNKNFNILSFKDTSKGIDKKLLNNIFKKFYSKTKYGTGIGLSFCKLVMDFFGGSISCKSQEGVFTEFILSFPKIKHKTN